MIRNRVKQVLVEQNRDRYIPKVIKWKGVNMVRAHSFLATIREIITWSAEIDVTRIGLVGDPHSGKSTLAKCIAHAVHINSKKIPYTVRIFGKDDLLDFNNTLKSLTPANYILIFDDVSFMGANANKKQIEMVKQATTEIRHLEGGQDVKIIAIMNYHYTLGLDKYLRMADFRYFLTVGSSEKENMEKIAGSKYNKLIDEFVKMRRMGVTQGYWTVPIGPKEPLAYKFRDPFIPVLFFNDASLRLIVTPKREWLNEICTECEEAEGNDLPSGISIDEFVKNAEGNFGSGNFQAAIKLLLYTNGLTVYGKHVVQSLRYLERARLTKIITLEKLAVHYGFKITKTRLDKNPKVDLQSLESGKSNSAAA